MKTISISEAREQLSSLIKIAKDGEDDVVIQNRGRPEVVVISYADYELLKKARENERRKEAIEALRNIACEVGDRNREIVDEQEIEEVADSITREAINTLAQKGDVSVQE